MNLFPTETDTAAMGDHDGSVVEGVVDVRQSAVGMWGRLLDLRRTFHVQSFVRTLVVEDLHELVEARLLLKEIGGSRLGGFFLQGQMHTLMTTILLRSTWLDAFDANAQAQPPHCQLAQIEQGLRGSERNPVVAADVGGQATLLKKPLKHGESVVFPGRGKRLSLLDRANGLLLTGDTFYPATIWLYRPETGLEAYAASIHRLASLAPQIKMVLGAHNIPFATPSVLPQLVTAFEAVRAGKIHPTPASPGQVIYKVADISFLMWAPESMS